MHPNIQMKNYLNIAEGDACSGETTCDNDDLATCVDKVSGYTCVCDGGLLYPMKWNPGQQKCQFKHICKL